MMHRTTKLLEPLLERAQNRTDEPMDDRQVGTMTQLGFVLVQNNPQLALPSLKAKPSNQGVQQLFSGDNAANVRDWPKVTHHVLLGNKTHIVRQILNDRQVSLWWKLSAFAFTVQQTRCRHAKGRKRETTSSLPVIQKWPSVGNERRLHPGQSHCVLGAQKESIASNRQSIVHS